MKDLAGELGHVSTHIHQNAVALESVSSRLASIEDPTAADSDGRGGDSQVVQEPARDKQANTQTSTLEDLSVLHHTQVQDPVQIPPAVSQGEGMVTLGVGTGQAQHTESKQPTASNETLHTIYQNQLHTPVQIPPAVNQGEGMVTLGVGTGLIQPDPEMRLQRGVDDAPQGVGQEYPDSESIPSKQPNSVGTAATSGVSTQSSHNSVSGTWEAQSDPKLLRQGGVDVAPQRVEQVYSDSESNPSKQSKSGGTAATIGESAQSSSNSDPKLSKRKFMSNRHNTSKRVFSIQTIIAKWSKQGQTSGSEFRQSLISCSHKAACQDKSLTDNSKNLPDLVPAVHTNSSQVELVLPSQSSRPFLEAGSVSSNAQGIPLQKELSIQGRSSHFDLAYQ